MKLHLLRNGFWMVPLLLVVLYWTSSRPNDEAGPTKRPAASRAAKAGERQPGSLAAPRLPAPDPRYTLGQQIDMLAATRRPQDAYIAYWLVQTCMDFMRTGALRVEDGDAFRPATAAEKADEARRCDGVTERMKTTRLEHLALAARGGASAADLLFLKAGPFGDPSALESRPDDPLVLAWKEEAVGYLELQAERGSVSSMITLVGEYNEDIDLQKTHPASALRYATAVHGYYDALLGGDPRNGSNPLTDEFMQRMAQGLSPEQIKLAVAEGQKISARAVEKQH
ncbi:hypothetical protein [Duganella sp. HH101]|uniref:hypothetical protein n=1 Tax=Duganella sp. HH101 TaxID=1781066 RepID=UPI0008755BA0|nr:hypothetical protein [Duganella sp. HH101]OFA01109.1 hypothetical protein DUGA2_44410 [Duganella sp. HH101]